MKISIWRLEMVQNDSLFGNAVRGEWIDKETNAWGDFHFALEDAPPGVHDAGEALVRAVLLAVEQDVGTLEGGPKT